MKVDCGTKATQQVSLRENAGDSLIFNECVNNPCHTCEWGTFPASILLQNKKKQLDLFQRFLQGSGSLELPGSLRTCLG